MIRSHPTSRPARTRPHRSGLPAGLRRGLRAVITGLADPGVAAATDRDRQLLARIRTRQREARLVAIVGGAPRSGTTTTTIGAAQVLDAIRRDTTVVIDARYGAASIGRRLTGAPPITDHNGLPLTREPLQLSGSPGDATWYAKPVDQQFTDLLDRLRGQFAFTLVDVGAEFLATGEAALRRADQIMVVVAANRDAVSHAKAGLGRVYSADPARIATVVLAVVGVDPSDQKGTVRQVSSELGVPLDRIVHVPFDRALAGGAFDPTKLRPATCEAYLRLGAGLAQPDPVGHR
jgi:Flp pilus assembly CpaE family ATPase